MKYPTLELKCGTCARFRKNLICVGGKEYCNKGLHNSQCHTIRNDPACMLYKPSTRAIAWEIAQFQESEADNA